MYHVVGSMYHGNMNIYPAILESTKRGVKEKVELVKDLVDRVQIDVIDGLFVDNLTVTPEDLKDVKWEGLKVDFHLMVDDPMEWVEECVQFEGARIIGQVERMGSQGLFLEWIAGYGREGGLALDLDTPIEALETESLEEAKVIVLLAVRAGYQGQKFDERVKNKIRQLRQIYRGEIVVDGGIDKKKIDELEKMGADGVAIGSFLWQGRTREKLKELIKK